MSAQTLVFLERAETLQFDEDTHPGAQLLTGNVQFRHDDAYMYCDSAYFYEQQNSLDAFGNVRFVQGDTLFGYSDLLFYDGNTKFARMRRNVRLIDKATILETDSLNYDRVADIAWYWTGGQIQDSLNVLTSRWGQYESRLNQALFKTDVHLINERFVMDADTLKYNTQSHIADILGPTTILYEEETTITTTLGWYNTDNEKSMLLNRSLIEHTDGKTMIGDTIFYDKRVGYGQALRNMQLTDSVQHVTLYGNYGEMYEKSKDANHSDNARAVGSHGYATDSALMVDWSDSAAFTYMHADTLFTEEILYTDTLLGALDSITGAPDTTLRDTSFRLIRGYYGARVYREDMQAVCDSAIYNSRDSIMSLFGKPIAWTDNQQIAAKHIEIFFRDSTIDYAHGIGDCIAIQQQTPRYFNQMAGKEMFAYIRNSELRQVDVTGNAETVFFPQDEKTGDWIGVNKTQSSFVKVFMKPADKTTNNASDQRKSNRQTIDHVVFTTASTGTLYPIDHLPDEQTHLSQFFWAENLRPNQPGDVFLHPEKQSTSGDLRGEQDEAVFERSPNGLRTVSKNEAENNTANTNNKLKKKTKNQ